MIAPIDIPADPGTGGWNTLLPQRQPRPPLQQSIEADYLIVGGGFAGLAAALRLQQLQPQASVVLLEGRSIAAGPAGRNSGFMIDLPHDLSSSDYAASSAGNDNRETNLNRVAIRFSLDAAKQFGMSQEAISQCGKINAAASDRGLKHNLGYARHLDRIGENYQMLDASQMHALTGSHYYQGGLWTPGTAILQPALYIRELADGLAGQGLGLYENSAVVDLQRKNDRWCALTSDGSVTANKVILAVNGVLNRFGYLPRRLMHVFTYASITRPLNSAELATLGGQPSWAFTPADAMGTTVRRISGTGGDRIVVRNRFTYDPSMEVSEQRLQNVAKTHRRAFAARFPMLPDVDMQHSWGGRLCLSLNGVGVTGELQPGLYSACCQNGLGTAKGTVAGIVAAQQAAQRGDALTPDYRPEPAPRRLVPEPFMWLGANGYMRLKEWRAGAEF